MGLIWPVFLTLLLGIPLLVWGYVWVLKRRRRYAIPYSSISLVREAIPGSARWRRHLPFALFVLSLLFLILALARPVSSISITSSRANVILALDVSRSMCASDIEPNRLLVAQEAAETFIENQPSGTRIGIVAFSGFAELIVPPTSDKEVLLEAVGSLTTGRRTAIGSAILRSLHALSEVNAEVAPLNAFVIPQQTVSNDLPDVPLQPDIVVLLTDGASNSGALPLDAAQAAADRGIRVYTIGFGTERGAGFRCTAAQLGLTGFGTVFFGGFGGRGRFRRGLDEDTLQQVAAMTDAEYYLAESADELLDVFATVPAHLVTTDVETEVTAVAAALAALLAFAAVGLSLYWNPYP